MRDLSDLFYLLAFSLHRCLFILIPEAVQTRMNDLVSPALCVHRVVFIFSVSVGKVTQSSANHRRAAFI